MSEIVKVSEWGFWDKDNSTILYVEIEHSNRYYGKNIDFINNDDKFHRYWFGDINNYNCKYFPWHLHKDVIKTYYHKDRPIKSVEELCPLTTPSQLAKAWVFEFKTDLTEIGQILAKIELIDGWLFELVLSECG